MLFHCRFNKIFKSSCSEPRGLCHMTHGFKHMRRWYKDHNLRSLGGKMSLWWNCEQLVNIWDMTGTPTNLVFNYVFYVKSWSEKHSCQINEMD